MGKHVEISVEGLKVRGKLLFFQQSVKEKPHRPPVLILEGSQGKMLARGSWTTITEK